MERSEDHCGYTSLLFIMDVKSHNAESEKPLILLSEKKYLVI